MLRTLNGFNIETYVEMRRKKYLLCSIKSKIGNNDKMFTFAIVSVRNRLSWNIYMTFFILLLFILKEERSEIFPLFLRQLKQHTQCNKLGKKFSFGSLNRNVYLFVLKCCIVCTCTAEIYMYAIRTQFTIQYTPSANYINLNCTQTLKHTLWEHCT